MTNSPGENQQRIGFSEIHFRSGGTIGIAKIITLRKDFKTTSKVNPDAVKAASSARPELRRQTTKNPPHEYSCAGRWKVFYFGFLLLILRMQIKKTMRLLQSTEQKKSAHPSRKRFGERSKEKQNEA
jgi:hypothetical protein